MTHQPDLPRPARWLLRWSRVPREMRAEVEADLHELFVARHADRGALHAHWRLYHDLASLWFRPSPFTIHCLTPSRDGFAATPRSKLALLGDARGDLRYGVRMFARQPAILLLTIVGLSLGLGIATAAFSMMNAAVLRGEGVADPDRAPGILRATDRSVATAWSYDEFVHLREGSTRAQVESVLTDGARVGTAPTEVDAPVRALAFVSGGFFGATGGPVIVGRPLQRADEQSVGPPPVVVSYIFWTSTLNRDPAVVGRTIRVGRTDATIVGVAERGFTVPNNRMLWIPLTAYRAVYGGESGAAPAAPRVLVEVFGRLRPGVTFAEAEAQLSGVSGSLPGVPSTRDSAVRVRLDPHAGLGRMPSSNTYSISVFVFAVIGLVLLLACANVATVLISTAITREREMGVRAALGASRWRIVRQLMTESMALGTIAATIGLAFAHWAIPVIAAMLEAPEGADLAPDLNVYVFLGIVTLASGVGAGLAPAWHGRGADLLTPLKGDGARQNRVAPRRLRSLLVMTQAGVSVLLIVLATLFVRAAIRSATVDVGFNATGLYAVSVGVDPGTGGAGISSFWRRALSEVQTVPGVAAIALAEIVPFGDGFKSSITHETPARVVFLNRIRAEYFDTLGLRILDGRNFTSGEITAKTPVALISQSLARAYWHGQSPLGQLLPQEIPLPPTTAPGKTGVIPAPRPVIIGVVADAITARLHERSAFAVYEPLDPGSEIFARLIVRVGPGTTGVVQEMSQRLRAIDPRASITITSVAAKLQQEAARPRMLAALTGFVGVVAIILCVIGLYGVTASVVSQRTREMGVRVAMGARPADLLRLLMWDSLRPVVVGLAIGTGAAILASRVVLAVMFFGVSPRDPIAFVGAAAILLAAAALAVLVPTRRAAAVDAASVLRQS